MQTTRTDKAGFTLIELLIVIAILGSISIVSIKSYGNLKYRQAKRMNVTKIKQIQHQIAVYDLVKEDSSDNNNDAAAYRFNNMDSLLENCGITSDPMLTDTGKAGTFDWTAVSNASCKIYDGTWRQEGKASKTGSTNKGLTDTLAGKLGVYYLNETDAKLLNDAGIAQVLVHAGTPNRAAAYSGDIKGSFGGGPTWRPEMSPTYPMVVSNGCPVVVLRPNASSTMTGYIYDHFDCSLTNDYTSVSESDFGTLMQSCKIVLFGLNRFSTVCKASVGLDSVPYNPVFDKFYYRQYLLAFLIRNGGQGRQSACRFLGVLDCEGNDLIGAEYGQTWQISEN
ncbi:MAG: type II secretion system protein [Kiritimatiellae bacterium]|nr:type II secretion system protein [Kiritimatiellia bacterium]